MAETATPIKPPVEKAPALQGGRFGLEAEYNQRWRATVPVDTLPEQTLDQGFWANVSMHFNPGDEIVVMPDDMTWKQILHVIGCGKLFAHVMQLELYELQTAEDVPELPPIYVIEYAGPHHKWRVVRDGQPLKSGFRTQSEAGLWAKNHESAVQR